MKTYTFHVSLPGTGRTWRKLELRDNQTLEDLHFAIQNAYEWGADHLYSFFMSNQAWDESTEYTLPEGDLYDEWEGEYDEEEELEGEDEIFSLEEWRTMGKKDQEKLVREFTQETGLPPSFFHDMIDQLEQIEQHPELLVDEGPGDVRTTTLASLNLKPRQEFMYLFDYGDEHRFKVRVDAINEFSDPDAAYPRLVESVGEAPEQYPDWDEDEEWDEDV